jgi:Flp pilus assembly protein TadG
MMIRKATDDGESGQSMVETSFMMLVIFMVIFWVMEMCGMMYTYATIANAAEEGVRYGMTRSGVAANDSRIITRVQNFAGTSLHDVSNISVTVALPDGSSTPPNRVKVTVTYTYVPWLSKVVKNPLVMHAYAEGRIVVP